MVSRLTAEYGRSGSVVQTLEGTGGDGSKGEAFQ